MQDIGKIIIGLGILLILAGAILYFFGNKFQWLGNLPGDIRIEKENVRIYVPIATMILISLAFSLLIYIIRKFF